MALSLYEQYLYHCRKWLSDYHLSFEAIEKMPLELLLDLEIIDSKVEAAFADKRKPKDSKKMFLNQILH